MAHNVRYIAGLISHVVYIHVHIPIGFLGCLTHGVLGDYFCLHKALDMLFVMWQFFLTHSELRQYEEERTEVGRIRLILDKSKSLPVHCRTANGG